jgi:hypothetical protein
MSVKSFILSGAAALALVCAPFARGLAATGNSSPTKSATATHAAANPQPAETGPQKQAAGPAGGALSHSELKNAQRLSQVKDPNEAFANRKVEDRQGNAIGEVKRVVTTPKGIASSLQVDVTNYVGAAANKIVAIRASRLSWLPDQKMLVTSLTKKQIKAMRGLNETASLETHSNTKTQ